MPNNKKQLQRMKHFIAEVKKHKYPNSKSFAEKLRDLDIDLNLNIACTPRTVQRDIDALKKDFGAPLRYNSVKRGYEIKGDWDFTTPIINDTELLTLVLGCRLAENIFPDSLKDTIENAVNFQLAANSSESYDTAYLDSLMICGRMTTHIDSDIFELVFNAWKEHEAISIEYINAQQEKSERIIEPQVFVYQDGAWFVKAYCHNKRKVYVFALHRMISVEKTDTYFEIEKDLAKEVRENGLFDFEEIKNIILLCENRIFSYMEDYKFHKEQFVRNLNKDTFELYIPSAKKDDLIRWIMCQAGQCTVIKPVSLKKEIAEFAKKLLENHS